jgi:hypothetical protein
MGATAKSSNQAHVITSGVHVPFSRVLRCHTSPSSRSCCCVGCASALRGGKRHNATTRAGMDTLRVGGLDRGQASTLICTFLHQTPQYLDTTLIAHSPHAPNAANAPCETQSARHHYPSASGDEHSVDYLIVQRDIRTAIHICAQHRRHGRLDPGPHR